MPYTDKGSRSSVAYNIFLEGNSYVLTLCNDFTILNKETLQTWKVRGNIRVCLRKRRTIGMDCSLFLIKKLNIYVTKDYVISNLMHFFHKTVFNNILSFLFRVIFNEVLRNPFT